VIEQNFVKIYEQSFKNNWTLDCLTDYGEGISYTYGEVAEEIARMHLIFRKCNLRQGDKIAIIGKNNSHWCIAFLATITYGAIIVPILQDFTPGDVHHIINHSESVFLFTSDAIWDHLEEDKLLNIRGIFSLSNFRCLYQRDGEAIQHFINCLGDNFSKAYPHGFTEENVQYADIPNTNLILINYTSGTTGFSKGVMHNGNSLAGNVTFGIRSKLLQRCENVLSFLPLAHAYGCVFDFLTGVAVGAHVTLLGKAPSPKIMFKAFQEIKPNLIITVPLVIEKIYKNIVLPIINKRAMKMALTIPMLNEQIYTQIRKRLVDALGGNFKEVIIGGAAINPEVEEFFHRIKFPFTVGYGMIECAPLISYSWWEDFVPTSSGKIIDIMEARISREEHRTNNIGEIQVRGENVMMGYYKNEAATKEVFTEDGWLRTGDLGIMDSDGNIYLRGRSKTVILGSNGQNIFPEKIEFLLNNLPFVQESLVIERNRKLVALVYADYEALDSVGLNHPENIKAIMDENLKSLNSQLASYEQVNNIQLYPAEFEKTPKRSIKRFLYNSITDSYKL